MKGSQDLPDCTQRKSHAHWLSLQWEPPQGAAAHSKLTQNLVYNIHASTICRKKKEIYKYKSLHIFELPGLTFCLVPGAESTLEATEKEC